MFHGLFSVSIVLYYYNRCVVALVSEILLVHVTLKINFILKLQSDV